MTNPCEDLKLTLTMTILEVSVVEIQSHTRRRYILDLGLRQASAFQTVEREKKKSKEERDTL